jgi:type IX secretion system substrate protein
LNTQEAAVLVDHLNDGGRLYMEGGNTWSNDEPTAIQDYFRIEGLENGGDDLGTITGVPGVFSDGLTFMYDGDNQNIDHISAQTGAFKLFNNSDPEYTCAVANESAVYRTIGTSFEFGGLIDGDFPSTKLEWFNRMIDFFNGIYTNIEHPQKNNLSILAKPNPFNEQLEIEFELHKSEHILIEVFSMDGRKVEILVNMVLPNAKHSIIWENKNIPAGIYFIAMKTNEETKTIKLLKTN